MSKEFKYLLTEGYRTTKKMTGLDPRTNFREIYADPQNYAVYIKSLSEGLSPTDSDSFVMLAENLRRGMLESANSMYNIAPYETFNPIILRAFLPKLIAKELVNMMPINVPEVTIGFARSQFKRYDGDNQAMESGFGHEFPSMDTDVTLGPTAGVSTIKTANPGETDVLAEVGLDSDLAHLEKTFKIVGVIDSTNVETPVDIVPTVDGMFSFTTNVGGTVTTISGNVDFYNGKINWSESNDLVSKLRYRAVCSLEENMINPVTRFGLEKITFKTKGRKISAEWTIELEQDARALYDINVQAELVQVMAEQIQLDIDKEIIKEIIDANAALNPVSHVETFDLKPPTNFINGEKAWYENIIPVLNRLSAQIFNSSLIGEANILACNPIDAAIFESLNTFEYKGGAISGGEVGFRTASLGSGKWKVLVSSMIPVGQVIVKHRSEDLTRAAYVYAPYQPVILHPYPLGPIPSVTMMTRYATRIIRNNAFGILRIVKSV